MPIIYEPKGRAREYSPLAANLFTGCVYGCKYCYAPDICRKDREGFHAAPYSRMNVLYLLRNDARKIKGTSDQVLLCFSCDHYGAPGYEQVTSEALQILLENRIPVSILTKAGTKALRDLPLYRAFGNSITFGTTLTFVDDTISQEWEPKAATFDERIEALRKCKEAGIRTWASIEPVIDAEQSLAAIEKSLDVVDAYKIGKLNNNYELEKRVNWSAFLEAALDITRRAGKHIYVKEDLRQICPQVKVDIAESTLDSFLAKPFQQRRADDGRD